jgi:hypothetical protein
VNVPCLLHVQDCSLPSSIITALLPPLPSTPRPSLAFAPGSECCISVHGVFPPAGSSRFCFSIQVLGVCLLSCLLPCACSLCVPLQTEPGTLTCFTLITAVRVSCRFFMVVLHVTCLLTVHCVCIPLCYLLEAARFQLLYYQVRNACYGADVQSLRSFRG